jgi:hypothetical protein
MVVVYKKTLGIKQKNPAIGRGLWSIHVEPSALPGLSRANNDTAGNGGGK